MEALYRVDEFEFERLTQTYWHALIGKVAHSMSSQPMFDKYVLDYEQFWFPGFDCIGFCIGFNRFPPNTSEDPTFCRPAVPFDCGPLKANCGPETKRTPKSYC